MSYETKQREILFEFFKKNKDKNFSAEQIFEELKNENISLSAIYRNLSELEKNGSVRKVLKSGSRTAFFQFVDCDECKNHIHIMCSHCGKASHLTDEESKIFANQLLKDENFNLNIKDTVLYGTCKNCTKRLEKEKAE